MSDAADPAVGADPSAPVVDPGDINYDLPSGARTGAQPQQDGEPSPPEEKPEAEEEREAAEAGTTLAAHKGRLKSDLLKARERAQNAEATLESWRPIIQKLDGRPDLQQAVVEGRVTIAQAEATKEREDRAELTEIAEDLGYFEQKADGSGFDMTKPDLTRAERYRARHLKWARQTAEPMVQPLTQDSQFAKAMSRVEHAVKYATEQGDADPEIVREEMTAAARKNPAWLLDNDAGNLLYDRAVARTVRERKAGRIKEQPAPGRRDDDRTFVATEAPGGKRSGPRLTAAEKQLGEQYGLTDKDWDLAERHAGVKRGYTRLTDD